MSHVSRWLPARPPHGRWSAHATARTAARRHPAGLHPARRARRGGHRLPDAPGAPSPGRRGARAVRTRLHQRGRLPHRRPARPRAGDRGESRRGPGAGARRRHRHHHLAGRRPGRYRRRPGRRRPGGHRTVLHPHPPAGDRRALPPHPRDGGPAAVRLRHSRRGAQQAVHGAGARTGRGRHARRGQGQQRRRGRAAPPDRRARWPHRPPHRPGTGLRRPHRFRTDRGRGPVGGRRRRRPGDRQCRPGGLRTPLRRRADRRLGARRRGTGAAGRPVRHGRGRS